MHSVSTIIQVVPDECRVKSLTEVMGPSIILVSQLFSTAACMEHT